MTGRRATRDFPLAAVAALAVLVALLPAAAAAREDWTILSFGAQIEVRSDGSLDVVEAIEVDFGSLQKHGIFRDIPVRYRYDERSDRVLRLQVRSVTDAQGRAHRYQTSQEGQFLRVKIGDPDVRYRAASPTTSPTRYRAP